eukprot:4582927-Karenia_brevis.AAC.1
MGIGSGLQHILVSHSFHSSWTSQESELSAEGSGLLSFSASSPPPPPALMAAAFARAACL